MPSRVFWRSYTDTDLDLCRSRSTSKNEDIYSTVDIHKIITINRCRRRRRPRYFITNNCVTWGAYVLVIIVLWDIDWTSLSDLWIVSSEMYALGIEVFNFWGLITRRKRQFLRVILPDPSTRILYCLSGRDSATIPVVSQRQLFGFWWWPYHLL